MSLDRVAVIAPDLQVGADSVVIGQWRFETGDFVIAGDALVELVVPGLTVSIPSPVDGVLVEICRPATQSVQPGDLLGWVQPAEAPTDE